MGTQGSVSLDGVDLMVESRTATDIRVLTPMPSPYGADLPLVVSYGVNGGAILDK